MDFGDPMKATTSALATGGMSLVGSLATSAAKGLKSMAQGTPGNLSSGLGRATDIMHGSMPRQGGYGGGGSRGSAPKSEDEQLHDNIMSEKATDRMQAARTMYDRNKTSGAERYQGLSGGIHNAADSYGTAFSAGKKPAYMPFASQEYKEHLRKLAQDQK